VSEREPSPSPAAPTVIPFPFALPADFLRRLGYDHGRRLVGVYWQPAGDEAVFDDGVISLTGADPWTYLELVRRPPVADWLAEHDISFGGCDEPATHRFPVDGMTPAGHVSPAAATRDTLRTHRLEEWPRADRVRERDTSRQVPASSSRSARQQTIPADHRGATTVPDRAIAV
jgi:hypothetical protein